MKCASPTIYRWLFGFCGIKCVRATHFGPIRNSSDEQRDRWLDKTKQLARKLL